MSLALNVDATSVDLFTSLFVPNHTIPLSLKTPLELSHAIVFCGFLGLFFQYLLRNRTFSKDLLVWSQDTYFSKKISDSDSSSSSSGSPNDNSSDGSIDTLSSNSQGITSTTTVNSEILSEILTVPATLYEIPESNPKHFLEIMVDYCNSHCIPLYQDLSQKLSYQISHQISQRWSHYVPKELSQQIFYYATKVISASNSISHQISRLRSSIDESSEVNRLISQSKKSINVITHDAAPNWNASERDTSIVYKVGDLLCFGLPEEHCPSSQTWGVAYFVCYVDGKAGKRWEEVASHISIVVRGGTEDEAIIAHAYGMFETIKVSDFLFQNKRRTWILRNKEGRSINAIEDAILNGMLTKYNLNPEYPGIQHPHSFPYNFYRLMEYPCSYFSHSPQDEVFERCRSFKIQFIKSILSDTGYFCSQAIGQFYHDALTVHRQVDPEVEKDLTKSIFYLGYDDLSVKGLEINREALPDFVFSQKDMDVLHQAYNESIKKDESNSSDSSNSSNSSTLNSSINSGGNFLPSSATTTTNTNTIHNTNSSIIILPDIAEEKKISNELCQAVKDGLALPTRKLPVSFLLQILFSALENPQSSMLNRVLFSILQFFSLTPIAFKTYITNTLAIPLIQAVQEEYCPGPRRPTVADFPDYVPTQRGERSLQYALLSPGDLHNISNFAPLDTVDTLLRRVEKKKRRVLPINRVARNA